MLLQGSFTDTYPTLGLSMYTAVIKILSVVKWQDYLTGLLSAQLLTRQRCTCHNAAAAAKKPLRSMNLQVVQIHGIYITLALSIHCTKIAYREYRCNPT